MTEAEVGNIFGLQRSRDVWHMKILFLTPPQLYRSWPHETGGARHIFTFPPVSSPALAATVPQHDVRFLDAPQAGIGMKEYRVVLDWADTICIGVMGGEAAMNIELNLRVIKRLFPAKHVILGGHHATFFSSQWLDRGADVVVPNEGENVFPNLIRAIETGADLATVRGIVFRRNGETISTEPEPFEKSLDSFPIPRFDIVDGNVYRPYPFLRGPAGSIETSRGCPYRCEFCAVTGMWKNVFRMKSVGRVIAELDVLKGLGVRIVAFLDDSFAVDYRRTMELLDAIIERDYGFVFWSFMRADTAARHPDLLQKAARAGLIEAAVGFESVQADLHGRLNKGYSDGFDFDLYRRATDNLRKNGIFVMGLFVSDYPGDTGALHIRETFGLSDLACFDRFTPTPGAEAVGNMAREGIDMPELFYVDIGIAAWSGPGSRSNPLFTSFRNVFAILRPRLLLKGLIPRTRVRPWGLVILRALVETILSTTPRRIRTTWLLSRERTIKGRWRVLLERELGPGAVEYWARKVGGRRFKAG